MISERHANILEGVVANYIRTGEPVGSLALTEYLNLTVSPATVRAVLQDLESDGFLFQPHTSAGRIPTDRGYRFYVDRLVLRKLSAERRRQMQEQITELKQEYGHLAAVASRILSQLSEAVVVCGEVEAQDVQESGLRELFKREDSDVVDSLREVSIVMDEASQYIRQLAAAAATAEPQVWIGEEIPFFDARHTSLIAQKVSVKPHGTIVLIMVGPKRMPYQRNMSLLNTMTNLLEDNLI